MNWVPPIKDATSHEALKQALADMNEMYYIFWEIGVGTGLSLNDLLSLKVSDVTGKPYMENVFGADNVLIHYDFPSKLQECISRYTAHKKSDEYLFSVRSGKPVCREQLYRMIHKAGQRVGLPNIGGKTIRKTFAWHYYKQCGDIHIVQGILNHASPSITYRYLGIINPAIPQYHQATSFASASSRTMLLTDDAGSQRIKDIADKLCAIEKTMYDPMTGDLYTYLYDAVLTISSFVYTGDARERDMDQDRSRYKNNSDWER